MPARRSFPLVGGRVAILFIQKSGNQAERSEAEQCGSHTFYELHARWCWIRILIPDAIFVLGACCVYACPRCSHILIAYGRGHVGSSRLCPSPASNQRELCPTVRAGLHVMYRMFLPQPVSEGDAR